jgi:hypothetical protein
VEALRLPASSVAAISCQNGLGVVGGRFYVDVSVPGDLWCCRRLVLSWIQACGGDFGAIGRFWRRFGAIPEIRRSLVGCWRLEFPAIWVVRICVGCRGFELSETGAVKFHVMI